MAVTYKNYFGLPMPTSVASTHTYTGSAGSEPLSGSAGADLLTGGGLGHAMSGNGGDDTYHVNVAADVVIEQASEGVDTVQVKGVKGYVLAENVENMVLAGKITGFGNDLGNLITGNIYSQVFVGGAGNDVLVGNKGADTFVFGAGSGYDLVWDFSSAESDVIRLQGYGLTRFEDVQAAMSQEGLDVVLTLSATDAVRFRNTTTASFTAQNFQLDIDATPLRLAFSEEFDSLSLRNSATPDGRWSTTFPFGMLEGDRAYTSRTLTNNNEKQLYVDPTFKGTTDAPLGINPFSIEDGVLGITGERTDFRKDLWYYKYTSGLLTSRETYAQQYGYFEVSAKLPAGQGLWPAFWLLPTAGTRGLELDVLEQVGREMVYFTSHSAVDDKTRRTEASYVPDFSTNFHSYGMLWTNTKVAWYIDGVEQASMATPSDMHTPMYMLLNLAVGGNWPGDPAADFQSATFNVDYVRAYSLDMAAGADGDLSVNLADRVGAGDRSATAFRVTGLDEGATAVLTFVDGAGNTVTVDVAANGDGVADLSALQEGSVTVSIVETKNAETATGKGDSFVLDSSVDSDLTVSSLELRVGSADKAAAPFTVAGLNEGWTAEVTFTDKLGAQVQVAVAANGQATADLSSLADGTITMAIAATNGVGVVAKGAGGSTILDTTADVGGDLAVVLQDTAIVGVEAAQVYFTLTGLDKDAAATVTFTDSLGATVVATARSGTSYVDLTGLVDGAVSVSISAVDGADNVTTGAGASLTLSIAPDPDAGLSVTAGPNLIGASGRAAVAYSVAGLGEGDTGLVTFADSFGQQVTIEVTANGLGAANLTSLADGAIEVSVIAHDGAGNVTSGSGGIITLDTDADAGDDLTIAFEQPGGTPDLSHFAYQVTGLDDDATAIATFTDSAGDSLTVQILSNGSGFVDLTSLAPGAVSSTIQATDAADNISPEDPASGAVEIVLEQEDLRPIVADQYVRGTSQNDTLTGGDGNDVLVGGAGNDVLDGGAGKDTVSYAGATAGVTVVLRSDGLKQDTKGAGQDVLLNIESFVGSAHDDSLSGDAADNILIGGGGNDILKGKSGLDILVGGAGDDHLTGGDGADTVWYGAATSGITIDLRLTAAQDTSAEGFDAIQSIENVVGTAFDDILTGSQAANVLDGGDGDDVLSGGAGPDTLLGGAGDDLLIGGAGNDVLDGGAGSNTASYADSTGAIKVNLSLAGSQNTGAGGQDTLNSIRNLSGSNHADALVGNDLDNVLAGGDGADTLTGGLGNDNLDGGTGNDLLDGGPGDDSLEGGDGFDTVSYSSAGAAVTVSLSAAGPQSTGGGGLDSLVDFERAIGTTFADHLTGAVAGGVLEGGLGDDTLVGLDGADTLLGGGGDDSLVSGAGNDSLNGGVGVDTASYSSSAAGVTVSLAISGVQDTGGAGLDILTQIENLTGSAMDDVLTGNSAANLLIGGGGSDSLNGGGGRDVLIGGAAADQLTGGGGGDTFLFKELGDSTFATTDTITDFARSQGDKIDLSAIDADTSADGDQGFALIGAAAFTHHAGELRLASQAGVLHLQGDVDGDGSADFQLALAGVLQIQASDIIL